MKRGDRVQLRSIPAAVLLDAAKFPDTFALFSKATGNIFTIRGKGEAGLVELWVDPNGSDSSDACSDSIWVEPDYLKHEDDSDSF